MFEASHPFAFFDYFRVPYDVCLIRGPARSISNACATGSAPCTSGRLKILSAPCSGCDRT